MKYYLIVGEALKKQDVHAEFRFFGGDMMAAVGGTRVKHYKDLAYMGFIPVLLHLPTILQNMKMCQQDILQWQPDVVILVDYPGFNLKIAKFVKANTKIPVYYYISPKIWAWKEYRIKNIKRDVDEMFSILPFEVDFYEKKHHYPGVYGEFRERKGLREASHRFACGVPETGDKRQSACDDSGDASSGNGLRYRTGWCSEH